MTGKLKELSLVAEELRITRERFAKLKGLYVKFVETAKKETQADTPPSVKVEGDPHTGIFIEYLDRRARLAFNVDDADAQGYVNVYDVTAPLWGFGQSEEHHKPFFSFSFNGSGTTNLLPTKLSETPTLLKENDVLCIVLNIVDALLQQPRPSLRGY
jgi:hypothetical protein